MDTYNEFAQIYDELMDDFDYENWFGYIEDIFKKYDKKPRNILEMACGTGNISYYFGNTGYRLTAFDISEEMLAKAYKKLGRFKNIKLLKQDMIDFKLNEKFDVVISLCDSVNYVLESRDLKKTFKNVYEHLDQDGIFIFDINSYYKLKHIIGNNTFIEDREDIYYIWQNEYEEDRDIANFYLTFFHREGEDCFKRFDEVHRERAYKVEEIKNTLKDVGFNKIDIYEGFTFNEIKDETQRINFVAMK